MKNKFMKIFDRSYDQTFGQIIQVTNDREIAKGILGLIYTQTWDKLVGKSKSLEEIFDIFEQVKLSHGISFAN